MTYSAGHIRWRHFDSSSIAARRKIAGSAYVWEDMTAQWIYNLCRSYASEIISDQMPFILQVFFVEYYMKGVKYWTRLEDQVGELSH
jgi:hypothetical protein